MFWEDVASNLRSGSHARMTDWPEGQTAAIGTLEDGTPILQLIIAPGSGGHEDGRVIPWNMEMCDLLADNWEVV